MHLDHPPLSFALVSACCVAAGIVYSRCGICVSACGLNFHSLGHELDVSDGGGKIWPC